MSHVHASSFARLTKIEPEDIEPDSLRGPGIPLPPAALVRPPLGRPFNAEVRCHCARLSTADRQKATWPEVTARLLAFCSSLHGDFVGPGSGPEGGREATRNTRPCGFYKEGSFWCFTGVSRKGVVMSETVSQHFTTHHESWMTKNKTFGRVMNQPFACPLDVNETSNLIRHPKRL